MACRSISKIAGRALRALAVALPCAGLPAATADARGVAPRLVLERVVMLMRHGVRPPTKTPPLPAGVSADPWPGWPVPPGWLTPHGAAAIRLVARYDRAGFMRSGLLPARACPGAGEVLIISDSDERTIATGDAYLSGLAPGCGIPNAHRAQDEADPLFSPVAERTGSFDAAKARAAVVDALGPGGLAAAEARQRGALATIDRILCGAATGSCGIGGQPTALAAPRADARPKLVGALDLGSTAAQVLLLEYADGKPMSEVGWGRASAADIVAVGALHSAEFAILARPRYVAAANIAPIARRMLGALDDRTVGAPRLTVLVGHDTNVASLAGLLDLHWEAPGFAPDDPPPGGALILERLRDQNGRRFVRVVFRAQSLDQIRTLQPLARSVSVRTVLRVPGCREARGLCPASRFGVLLRGRLASGS